MKHLVVAAPMLSKPVYTCNISRNKVTFTAVLILIYRLASLYTKQKHLGCKKGEANQKQQLSDYRCIRA